DSERAYGQALALARDLPDEAPYRREEAHAHVGLGNVFTGTGRPRDAEREYGAAADLLRRWGPGEQEPEALGLALRSLANPGAARDLAAGVALDQEAVELYERLSREHPYTPRFGALLGQVLRNQAIKWGRLGRRDEEERTVLRSLEVRRALAAAFP